jgi:hypothetical protein
MAYGRGGPRGLVERESAMAIIYLPQRYIKAQGLKKNGSPKNAPAG